jgi:hypothetical protein
VPLELPAKLTAPVGWTGPVTMAAQVVGAPGRTGEGAQTTDVVLAAVAAPALGAAIRQSVPASDATIHRHATIPDRTPCPPPRRSPSSNARMSSHPSSRTRVVPAIFFSP